MKYVKWTLGAVAGGLLLMLGVSMFMGTGSTWLANRWVNRFQNLTTVQDASAKYNVVHHEFADGSWIFGVAVGSHGNPWGGTVVTKDSTGQTRVFFGHVCVSGAPLVIALKSVECTSLAAAYSNLTLVTRMKEQRLH
jgi:hypothetical protein